MKTDEEEDSDSASVEVQTDSHAHHWAEAMPPHIQVVMSRVLPMPKSCPPLCMLESFIPTMDETWTPNAKGQRYARSCTRGIQNPPMVAVACSELPLPAHLHRCTERLQPQQ